MKTETVQIVAPLVLEIPRPPNYLRPAGNDRAQPIDVATLSLLARETGGAVFSVTGDSQVQAAATAHGPEWAVSGGRFTDAARIASVRRNSASPPRSRMTSPNMRPSVRISGFWIVGGRLCIGMSSPLRICSIDAGFLRR